MKRFFCVDKAIKFAEDGWKAYFDSLSDYQKNMLLNAKAKGRFRSNRFDRPVIKAYYKLIREVPSVEEEFILYRGGSEKDFCKNRPFLAASFNKFVAKGFAKEKGNHIYKIKILKGSRVLPIC